MDSNLEIFKTVCEALKAAAEGPDTATSDRDKHRERSQRFVGNLAALMRDAYKHDDSVYVLNMSHKENHDRFGSYEVLFDILACRTETVRSSNHGTELTYITAGLWAVESEMARDSREALYDFNKLVLADCAEKLFVGSITDDVNAFLGTLAAPASKCKGKVTLALVTHPGEWDDRGDLQCYVWDVGKWNKVLSK